MRLLTAALFLIAMTGVASANNAAPPGNLYDISPFNKATLFVSVACNPTFDCSHAVPDDALLAAANTCAASRLKFSPELLTKFVRSTGTYENCAIPETYQPKDDHFLANAQWPICCVHEVSDGVCQFSCNYYRSNGN